MTISQYLIKASNNILCYDLARNVGIELGKRRTDREPLKMVFDLYMGRKINSETYWGFVHGYNY